VNSYCGDIGFPLLGFPVSDNFYEHEARDNVGSVLFGRQVQACPDAGTGAFMLTRKAYKGKSAGRISRVCNDFSTCLPITKAQKFSSGPRVV
jgi:hypothetical protein